MNYEYTTSECYDFIARKRGWETARQPLFERYPILYGVIAALLGWALIVAPFLWS